MSFEQYCPECEVSFRTSTCPSCGWSYDLEPPAALRSDSPAREGGIEVEVTAIHGHSVVREVRGEHEIYGVESGSYVIYPRPQVGDPNDGGER